MSLKRVLPISVLVTLGLALAAAPAVAAIAQPVIVAATPAASTPQVLNGRVQAIVQIGDTVVVGGKFTQVKVKGGPILARNNLFAFSASTGAISPTFTPTVSGGAVFTLQPGPDGQSVIAGGRFTQVDGQARNALVELELADGSRDTAFRPAIAHGPVLTSVLSGGRLYVGGSFTKAGGVARTGLAAVDPSSGVLDPSLDIAVGGPISGTVEVSHMAVSPDGSTLAVSGPFTTVAGQPRAQLALIDLTQAPAALSSWATPVLDPAWVQAATGSTCRQDADGNVRGIDFAPDGSYFVVGTTGGPAADCDSVMRFPATATGPGQMPAWVDHTGGDSITQVAATGTAIYAGGHQRWMENDGDNQQAPGSIPRAGIAALDPVNGMPFAWNPGRRPRGSGVFAFLATPQGLWIGGDSTYTAGTYRPRIAFFPTAGGTAVQPVTVQGLPGQLAGLSAAGLSESSFDGVALGAPAAVGAGSPWTSAGGTFMVNGTLYAFTSDGHLFAAPFDGQTLGAAQTVPQYLPAASIANIDGAFFDAATGRLYYTVAGDSNVYWRLFEPQDGLIGETQTATGQLPVQFTALTRVGGQLVWADLQGNLQTAAWTDGGALGTPTTLSGPAVDGRDWSGTTGLFLAPG